MMYSQIDIPSQGDGRTMVLIGQGFFRGRRLAAVHYRVASALIDAAIFFFMYWPLKWIAALYTQWASAQEGWIAGWVVDGLATWVALAVLFANVVWMQSRSGQSFGKMCLGLILVHPRVDPMDMDHDYLCIPSVPMLLWRYLLHSFDLLLLTGVWVILFSKRRESLADMACNTLVLRPRDLDDLYIEPRRSGARDRA